MKRADRRRVFLGGTFFVMVSFFSVAAAQEIRYHSADRRDPFIPLVGANWVGRAAGVNPDDLAVDGVVYDPGGDSYALVGGEIYREGESLDGAKIVRILADRVIFLQESKETVVWLREEIVEEEQT